MESRTANLSDRLWLWFGAHHGGGRFTIAGSDFGWAAILFEEKKVRTSANLSWEDPRSKQTRRTSESKSTRLMDIRHDDDDHCIRFMRSVLELIVCIRNAKEHPEENCPLGDVSFIREHYPMLLSHVWHVLRYFKDELRPFDIYQAAGFKRCPEPPMLNRQLSSQS